MKKLFFFLLVSVAIFGLTACNDDDEGAMPPIYQGFRVEPSNVLHPGDKVTITAVQQQKGRYIYGAKYSWSIKRNGAAEDEGPILVYGVNEGGESNYKDPQWVTTIPSDAVPGIYTCRFEASWQNAADGETRTWQSVGGEGLRGTITSVSSTLFSRANGSFTLSIQ